MYKQEQFEYDSKDVIFNLSGINLKRNKYIYSTIEYSNVDEIRIVNGYLLKKRLLVILGALCIIWLGYNLISTGVTILIEKELPTYEWLNHFFNKSSLASVWGPLLLIIMGLLAIYNAFSKSCIAIIKTEYKTFYPRIKEIEKRREIDSLINFLQSKNINVYKEYISTEQQ